MNDFQYLAKKFYNDYGDRLGESGHLEPTFDSAVSQFHNHQNSVGFLPLYSCPGATMEAGGCAMLCYARHGRSRMISVEERLMRNTHILFSYCRKQDVNGLADEFVFLMDMAQRQHESKMAREAKDKSSKIYRLMKLRGPLFRFHWSGDFVHPTHALAVRLACERRPEVRSWTYTRSFHLLDYLYPPPRNFRLLISLDGVNEKEALEARRRYPWVGLAHMGNVRLNGFVSCPKDINQGCDVEGACARCGLCYTSKSGNIHFKIKRYLCQAKTNPLMEVEA